MSQTAILYIQIFAAIIGILVFLFAFFRYAVPIACRNLAKPRIETKISLGKEVDIESPLTKEKVKLFTAREGSIWLCTNRNIELLSVTFRRLCKYQKNCMLYRFFLKADLLKDNTWCSCASVDDWVYTDTFICHSNVSTRENESREFFEEGRLTLVPKVNRIVKDSWVALDIPLRLRDKKLHIIELTISLKVKGEDMPFLNRLINRILNPINREVTYSYSTKREIHINMEDRKEKEKEETKNKETDKKTGHRVAFSYQGFGKMVEYHKIMTSLVEGVKVVLKKGKPPTSKIPIYELRNGLKEKLPKVKTVFTEPPDGIYYAPNKETIELLTQKVWLSVRDFARTFLDCESYSKLCSHSMSCFLLMPEILSRTYIYLITASENSFVSIAVNISNRSNMLFIALVRIIYSEFKIRAQITKQKRAIRKDVDKMANYFNIAKSKS